ncbi:hypothetical protein SmJEL517_g02304 [Synchytrium microbalum]|uniref:Uncharacterized protein n=1 Tax=Synchytrium microbalum TaxID=1806994 RepID=A0A507C6I2_9FUNG|nr:uncharacterized protein SmJEL517_g02304 [Synchytrium microbalum]TPX35232.1 hypothetical protein SmJEL517_g02304 [Synchytrium microbalum]
MDDEVVDGEMFTLEEETEDGHYDINDSLNSLPTNEIRKGGLVGVSSVKSKNVAGKADPIFVRGHAPEFKSSVMKKKPVSIGVGPPPVHPAKIKAMTPDTLKSKEKREWMDTLIKLRSRIQALQRDVWISTSRTAHLKEELQVVDYTVVDAMVEDEKRKMITNIRRIRDMVIALVGHVKHVTGGNTYIEQLKSLMEGIESALLAFKEVQRDKFERLLLDEKRLQSELASHEERIMAWDTHEEASRPDTSHDVSEKSAKLVSKIKASLLDSQGSLPEVAVFQEYVAKHGGHYGGWDDLTHSAFVKLYKKHQSSNLKMVEAVMSNIPGISVEVAMTHHRWYSKYIELLEARKMALQRWKEQKNACLQIIIYALKVSQVQGIELSTEHDTRSLERDREEEARMRETKRKEIEEWKVARQKKQEEEERDRDAAAKRAADEAAKQKKHQEKIKVLVLERAHTKMLEEEQRKRVAEEAEKLKRSQSTLTEEELKRLQLRDKEVLARRKELQDRKKREEEEKEKRLDKLRASIEVHVLRDPERLLRPTEGFLKKHEKKEDEGPDLGQSVFHGVAIPRRHVPNWRQGL